MRQSHTAGEKLFVDYCGMTVAVYDPVLNQEVKAQIFVAALGASNYTFAEATESQSLPNWIGSHQRALAFFGGVPKAIVPDNLKSGVTSACRYEPGLNRSYQDFAEHYGVAVIPARPKRPKDKSKVEKAVQEVERQILAPLRDQRSDRAKECL
jgi:transposase